MTDCDLQKLLEEKVKDTLKTQEPLDIAKQKELFQFWEETRNQLLNEQIKAYELQRRKLDIGKKLQSLQEKEEKLRLFEEQDRIALGISKAPQRRKLDKLNFEDEVFVLPPGERKGKVN